MNTHKQAKAGGEHGANGEWYKGGSFINTVPDNAKGEARPKKKATGKQEIEPYKWEVAPVEGQRSLFRLLAGVECFNRETLQFTFNEELRLEYALPEVIEQRKKRIDMFNRGERWTVMR